MEYPKEKHIAIELMMFGDYRVQVWDENKNSMLDREYFCKGFASAEQTAFQLQTQTNLPLYIYNFDNILSMGYVTIKSKKLCEF
jgi:hypothetical protein